MHKTSAWPLALVYAGLVVYASLYPFSEWRYQGIVPWAFLSATLPKYWTAFDVVSNLLGYGPLGFLLALSALRSGRATYAIAGATALAGSLSFSLECLQGLLPARVPSSLDLALNLTGAFLGALLAWGMERLGWLGRWSRFRARWFVADARGGLVLLALWPMALLFPAAVPFGLGQVLDRVESALADALGDTPFLSWLPVRDEELIMPLPGAQWVGVTLGLMMPCLLGFAIIPSRRRRLIFLLVTLGTGVAATALSAALSFGPDHAWEWVSAPALVGLLCAVCATAAALWLPPRACLAVLVVVLLGHLYVLNQWPINPYFAQTLSAWEQGRFIRFHGLAQWLGWVWPYVVLAYVLSRVWRHEAQN